MSFPILLNLNNQVVTHQFRYRYSQPIDFNQYEIALGSISIYCSWRAITAHNSFKIIWPTASTNLYNPIANSNQVLHTFTSAGVEYGGLIRTSQGQELAYCPMQGTNLELPLSFLDQNMIPHGIIDNNVCILLLIRPKQTQQ
ncbi:unnamed protein product [Phytophthora fragariaefolia]|uniref:Unnamed protein product n=1 Tax=Phytophthora fragariaefolia TaxID=1490495 RepID=A0A9W6U8T2_9STRA|nr:unnamed protein product [Phytophthora fragariaefolia]